MRTAFFIVVCIENVEVLNSIFGLEVSQLFNTYVYTLYLRRRTITALKMTSQKFSKFSKLIIIGLLSLVYNENNLKTTISILIRRLKKRKYYHKTPKNFMLSECIRCRLGWTCFGHDEVDMVQIKSLIFYLNCVFSKIFLSIISPSLFSIFLHSQNVFVQTVWIVFIIFLYVQYNVQRVIPCGMWKYIFVSCCTSSMLEYCKLQCFNLYIQLL